VPVAIKDNLCTRGAPTTCGSRILGRYAPPYDATAVARLRAAGAVVLAKTNCDEFAMGSSNENSAYGPVRNPRDATRVPGGSSGGSAAAVAAGLVPLALGSDTGGSVRQPAAFCGVVGLKPTYGRVSRYGLVAFGSSLDQVGPLAGDVRDAALALAVMAGSDPADATSSAEPVPDLLAAAERGVRGLRVGRLAAFADAEGVAAEVRAALRTAADALHEAGAQVVDVDLPLAEYGIPIYYLVATSEASSNLARFDGVRYGDRRAGDRDPLAAFYEANRGAGFGAEVKRRIVLGTFALSAGYHDEYYGRALRARARLRRQIDDRFARVDLLLLPTTPTTAFPLGEKVDDPLAMYLSDVFTVLANLGGHPAVSIPAPGRAGSLPVGVQLMARRFDEATLVAAAAALEERGFTA
jgi:aspartyl-tRNA(Asn)/glutamyl-tRNA(Gln) amidotransferase subunit A